ncbi:DUF58 domain-containing protein [Kytococcus sp. Marseille-QA3725]
MRSSAAASRTLPGLTMRGWVLLFAGLVLVGVGQYFGLTDLSRLGVLLVVLTALTWLLGLGSVRTTRTELTATPEVASVDEPVRLRVRTRSTSPLPGAPVVGHLPVHRTWGRTAELGILPLQGEGAVRELTLTPTARGRYEIGPVLLDRTDPFGLTRQALTRSGDPLPVAVRPRVVDYPGARVRRLVQDATRRTATVRHTSDTVDATSVREYGRGDDVRRIHWRSTARTGDLMVRHDDTEAQPWLLVALDEAAAWGDPPADANGPYPGPPAFEAAVRVAAGLVRAASRAGLEVRLLTADGLEQGLHQRTLSTREALDHLAGVAPRETRPTGFADQVLAAGRAGGLGFLLTAGDRLADVGSLAERRPRHAGTALVVTRDEEPAAGRRDSAVFGLQRGGWTVQPWDPSAAAEAAGEEPAADDRVRRALDLLTRTSTRGETA